MNENDHRVKTKVAIFSLLQNQGELLPKLQLGKQWRFPWRSHNRQTPRSKTSSAHFCRSMWIHDVWFLSIINGNFIAYQSPIESKDPRAEISAFKNRPNFERLQI